jgi:hypothetical protein
LQSIVADLAQAGEATVVIGWDLDNAPALLVPGHAFAQSSASLRTIYPDGFVAADQSVSRALIVDFDDSDSEADEVWLTTRA